MPPQVVPLVWVRAGDLVTPQGPRRWTPHARGLQAAAEAAHRLFAAHGGLYVWDVDGNEYGEANLDFYQALDKAGVTAWADAGCRRANDLMDVFVAGAHAATLRPVLMEPHRLAEAAGMTESELHLGFAFEGQGVEGGRRARDLLAMVHTIGAAGVVLYQGDRADLHAAENLAFELRRSGVAVTWVAPAGNPGPLRQSEHVARLIVPEGRP